MNGYLVATSHRKIIPTKLGNGSLDPFGSMSLEVAESIYPQSLGKDTSWWFQPI